MRREVYGVNTKLHFPQMAFRFPACINCECGRHKAFRTYLTQDEVLDQFELILLVVLQHPLEVFLPARNVDRVNRLVHHLSRRRLSLGLTRWETHKTQKSVGVP